LAKSAQKLFFATMRKKRQENAKKPENVTFCHNNAQKAPTKCWKTWLFVTEKSTGEFSAFLEKVAFGNKKVEWHDRH
jgi:phage terminase large subunit-like protein